ncbi:radical SAM protein [Streptomyces ficellus]|uniref:radical SAM protein n=1 Tax=Streptomyces ficellus TaxID=1977088 RepID=UPI00338D8E89
MTTAVRPVPPERSAAGILSVECDITGNCQLTCSHCCTLSGPKVSHGEMTLDDWRRVMDDTAALGIPAVQLIGGEPTRSVYLLPLITHALGRGLEVEVYSNFTHIRACNGTRSRRMAYVWPPATTATRRRNTTGSPTYGAATSGPARTSSRPCASASVFGSASST